MMSEVIQDGMVVSLGYTLRLANGEIVDYSEADEPLEYLHGAGNIVPGLERELSGLQLGDVKDVEVSADDGYGAYDPEDVETVERGQLPANLPLELGMVLAIRDSDGNYSEAYVRAIGDREVTLDFNHPLAGQKLFFSVEILGLREASEEELSHGHPHGVDGDEDEDFEDFEDEDVVDFEGDEDLEEEDFEDEDVEDDGKSSRPGRFN
jgi:FKBP-type peptidyl-prolyl cis-trans isomerase SlyD